MQPFFTGPYDETMALLHEARDYARHQEPRDRSRLPPLEAMAISRESLRLTSRLAEVLAWLMTRRAVAEGEITEDEAAAPERRLSQCSIHLDVDGARDMPPRLRVLLERSGALYVRISRLDSRITSVRSSRNAC